MDLTRFLRIALAAGVTAFTARPDAQGQAIAEKADLFFMDVARPILATRESTPATVRVRLASAIVAGQSELHEDVAAAEASGFAKNYAIANWRIVEGGGQIVATTGDQATFTAPAAKPAGGMVTLSVDIVPRTPNHPKVTLLGRVSITDAETTFMLDVPAAGIKGERYVLGSNDDSMLSQTLARLPAAQRQMLEAQMRSAGAAKGVNVDALMKQGRALYSSENDTTLVSIQFPGEAATAFAPPTQTVVSITFKGRGPGVFSVKPEASDNANHFSIARATGRDYISAHAQCLDQGGGKVLKMNCPDCTIAIESYGDGFVKGAIRGEVDDIHGCAITRGRLIGRFKVPIAK